MWINFPGLPLPFFYLKCLEKLGSLIGQPLKEDEAASSHKRPLMTQVLIEVDLVINQKRRI